MKKIMAVEASKGVAVEASKSGSLLAVGHDTGKVAVFDHMCRPVCVMGTGNEAVYTLAFSSNGDYLAVGYANGCVDVWDVAMPKLPTVAIEAHDGPVAGVAFNGNHVVTAGHDGTLTWFNDTTGKQVWSVSPFNGNAINAVVANGQAAGVWVVGVAAPANMWRVGDRQPVARLFTRTTLYGVDLSPDNRVAVVTRDGCMVYDCRKPARPIWSIDRTGLRVARWNRGGGMLALGGLRGLAFATDRPEVPYGDPVDSLCWAGDRLVVLRNGFLEAWADCPTELGAEMAKASCDGDMVARAALLDYLEELQEPPSRRRQQ